MAQIKVAGVVITHADNFTGEVEIAKGEVSLKVGMEALVRIVAEKVRADRMAAIERAKPAELLGGVPWIAGANARQDR